MEGGRGVQGAKNSRGAIETFLRPILYYLFVSLSLFLGLRYRSLQVARDLA